MHRSNLRLASLIALLATIATAISQDPPRSGTYQIQSGSYRQIGGFVPLDYQLPNSAQAFIALLKDPQASTADLMFLDGSQQTAFLRLTNGLVSGNTIRFQYLTAHPYDPTLPPIWVDYTITNAAGRLWISGSMTSSPTCCDIPYWFQHQDVTATFRPSLSIRVAGEVGLGWSSACNQIYQVQYQSSLGPAVWSNLGGPTQGNGTTNWVAEPVATGQPQRFYRIIAWP
jgi:hypothetical protein